jgi:hypothetical protein
MPGTPSSVPLSSSSGGVAAAGPLSKSVSTPSGAPAAKSGPPLWAIAGGIALASGVAMFFGLGYVKHPPPAAPADAPTAAVTAVVPPVSAEPPAPTVTPSAAVPDASAEPAVSAAASASAAPPASVTAAPKTPKTPVTPKATATPKTDGPCFGRDPDTGLRVMVPCKK